MPTRTFIHRKRSGSNCPVDGISAEGYEPLRGRSTRPQGATTPGCAGKHVGFRNRRTGFDSLRRCHYRGVDQRKVSRLLNGHMRVRLLPPRPYGARPRPWPTAAPRLVPQPREHNAGCTPASGGWRARCPNCLENSAPETVRVRFLHPPPIRRVNQEGLGIAC